MEGGRPIRKDGLLLRRDKQVFHKHPDTASERQRSGRLGWSSNRLEPVPVEFDPLEDLDKLKRVDLKCVDWGSRRSDLSELSRTDFLFVC